MTTSIVTREGSFQLHNTIHHIIHTTSSMDTNLLDRNKDASTMQFY